MIDLHTHVLPKLDDGPARIEESIEMCRIAYEQGTRTIVATPHFIYDKYYNPPKKVFEAVAGLKKALSEKQIFIDILPGSDVRLEYNTLELLKRDEICTINDDRRYILLEIPEMITGLDLTRYVSSIKYAGIFPIISHPERSLYFQENVEVLYNLVYSGALLQITSHSLIGGFGKQVKEFTERLLEHGLVHIIASDAHSPTYRTPGLMHALERASDLIGKEASLKLVMDNPLQILQGSVLQPTLPIPWKKKKRAWWRIRS